MSWIDEVPFEAAQGELREVYDEITKTQNGKKPYPISTIFGLRPEVLAHQDRFKRTFLAEASTLGPRRANYIAVAVSGMNGCKF
jgi:hypothetical protein